LGKTISWTEVEDQTLRRLARSGMLAGQIAGRMGYSAPAIRTRAAKLGIPIAKGSPGRSSMNVAIRRRQSASIPKSAA
jgi:hypothetical protein